MFCRGFMLLIPAVDPPMDANGNMISGETSVIQTIAFVNIIFYFLPHILMAVSLFSITRRRNLPYPWLSWVPFANYWTLGCIADDYYFLKTGSKAFKRKWLVTFSGLFVALMAVGALAEAAGLVIMSMCCVMLILVDVLALNIAAFVSLYNLYESCEPKTSVIFLILNVVFWFLQPMLVFLCCRKDRGLLVEE